ncbi:MAG: SPFH domain-containing protein [Thermoplasmata archaeon]
MVDPTLIIVPIVVVLIVAMFLLAKSIWIIQPYQQGIVTLFGSYKRMINPGLHFLHPLAVVIRIDLRTQVLEVPRQEVITKDNSPTNVDAIIYIKVVDAPKSIFQVQDYHVATVALAQTTLRSIIGDMELDEILYNRERINTRLRDILDEATDRWGVRVEAVEIKEVDPVGPVKSAMEEQTAAERQRRAAVLRSDGEKRSAILVAEGQKRSRILQAEGVRQSKILEAEGSRTATILEAQGEAQRLRVLALGASTLDAKALTVLSLDTVARVGDGQATKILFPFEFSRLMEGASDYLGSSRTIPERSINSIGDLERTVGSMDDILGPIPKQGELSTEIRSIEQEIQAESDAAAALVGPMGPGPGGHSVHGDMSGLPVPPEIAEDPVKKPVPKPATPASGNPSATTAPTDPRRKPPPATTP